MAEGIDAASFEFYEGIRILIPGAMVGSVSTKVGILAALSRKRSSL